MTQTITRTIFFITKDQAPYHRIKWPIPRKGIERDGVTYLPMRMGKKRKP